MNSALTTPAWTDNPEARALLAAIRIEQPGCWHLRRDSFSDPEPRFKGANARALRQLWEAARDAALAAFDHEVYARLTNHEHPDDLIDQLLAEPAVPYTRISFDRAPDNGNDRVAA
jgi:hypothetical protein